MDLLVSRLSRQRKKMVSTLHGSVQSSHLDAKWGSARHRSVAIMKLMHDRTLCTLALRKFSRIIALSNIERDFLVNEMRIPKDRTVVIPNGVPDEAFEELHEESNVLNPLNKELGFNPLEEPFIISIGRLSREKCFHHAIMTLPSLPRDIQYVIIGWDQGELPSLKLIADKLHLKHRVHFILTTKAQKYSLLSHALALILPSHQPIVVLEAMARGCPVIAARTGGQAELIREGRIGYTYEWANLRQLESLIRRFYEDANLRREMGEAAKSYSKEFSWPKIVDRICELYDYVTRG